MVCVFTGSDECFVKSRLKGGAGSWDSKDNERDRDRQRWRQRDREREKRSSETGRRWIHLRTAIE